MSLSAAPPVAFPFSNLFCFFSHPHSWARLDSRPCCARHNSPPPTTNPSVFSLPSLFSTSHSIDPFFFLHFLQVPLSQLPQEGSLAFPGPDPHPSHVAERGRAKARRLLLKRVKGPPFPGGCPQQLTKPRLSCSSPVCFARCKLFLRFTKRPSKLFHK